VNDILEIINDLTIVNRALEDEETPIHPQTIFAKHKTRELIAKYQKMVDEFEAQQDNLYA